MWIHIPTSVSPAVAACSTSELTSEAAATLARSVMWNGSLRRSPYLQRAWQTDLYSRHLYGPTCDPSTVADGVDSWMASLAAIRASRSRAQASPAAVISNGLGMTIHATYGQRSSGSSTTPDQAGAFSKMWELTFASGTSTLSARHLSDVATASRNRSSRRLTLARHTAANGCSSSPWIVPYESRSDQEGRRLDQIIWLTPSAQFENKRARQYQPQDSATDGESTPIMAGMPDLEIRRSANKHRDKIVLGTGPNTRTPGGSGVLSNGNLNDQIGLHVRKMQAAGLSAYAGTPVDRLMLSMSMMETLMGWPVGWVSEERMPSA